MPSTPDTVASRRRFLRFLATSPVMASVGLSVGAIERILATGEGGPGGFVDLLEQVPTRELITAADQALDVFDFQPVAQENLPIAHYAYMATGTDSDENLRANREGFRQFQLRMRRLVDVREIDMSVELFDRTWETPIVIQPTGSNKAFNAEGEIAVARAARAQKHLQVLSTVASSSIEDVAAARGEPTWWQLYASTDWNVTSAMLERAETAGCPVMLVTVDLQGGSNRVTLERGKRADDRDCTVCHGPEGSGSNRRRPIYDGLDLSNRGATRPGGMTWEYIDRLKDATSMKVGIKGIVTREDAALCVEHGVDVIVVSNHGGRAEASGRSTIESLPEVVEAVAGRIPIIVDSGFRRGTDVFKALALGATAVGIGRPYLWGLAAFGQEGVEAVLELLRRELRMVMRQAGTTTIGQIGPSHVVRRQWDG